MGNIAQIHRAMGDLEKVAEVNNQILTIDDQLPIWWEEYSKVLLELGRYDEAHRAIIQGLDRYYDYPNLHALLGLWCHKVGQQTQSVHAYERACRYDPENKVYRAAYEAAKQRVGAHIKKAAFSH
jgi:tetratricopeptide (TPR) repeat protein